MSPPSFHASGSTNAVIMPFSLGVKSNVFFLLLLSLFGNFLAPNHHNCAEVGGVPQLRLRLCASGGAVHSFGHEILLMFLHILSLILINVQ